ncbi:hypothetical protein [Microbacterium sp. UBA837]|uniref:hypothetical protein n=1 Tax=Microbacterium sp. UBA837 TaxID=1946956 RepID=UPI0025E71522|nr:hypothetical protein [Microbacterium sp. UBA837]
MAVPAIIPSSWRDKLAHAYLPETFASIIAVGSLAFGVTIVIMPDFYAGITSFALAFAFVEPHWWGLVMVALSVAMLTLLFTSRQAVAVPTFLLGMVWVLWVVPIAAVPGFAPSAAIAYWMISLLTITTGLACTVRREESRG